MSSRNIPVRFSDEMIHEMEAAAQRLGLENRSDVIKLCVRSFLSHIRQYGASGLPVNWQQIVKDMDGRTHRYAGQSPEKPDTRAKGGSKRKTKGGAE